MHKFLLIAAAALALAACQPEDVKRVANDALTAAGETRAAAVQDIAQAADAYCGYLEVRRQALRDDINALTERATVTVECVGE